MATKEQRRTEFMREVWKLAESGHHKDYLSIENALSGKYPEAREWLDSDSVREDIRNACERALAPRAKG